MGIIVNDTNNGLLKNLCKILMTAFQTLNNEFFAYVNVIRTNLQYTAQIISVQRMLNDIFDPVNRGIYLANGNSVYSAYQYRENEGFGEYLYRYNETETTPTTSEIRYGELTGDDDFIIYVPNTVSFDQTLMISIVNDYIFADKQFSIITF